MPMLLEKVNVLRAVHLSLVSWSMNKCQWQSLFVVAKPIQLRLKEACGQSESSVSLCLGAEAAAKLCVKKKAAIPTGLAHKASLSDIKRARLFERAMLPS